MASRSRLAAAEDMGKIIEAIRFSPRALRGSSAAFLCALCDQKPLSQSPLRKATEFVEKTCPSQHSRDPGFNRFSQLTQASFKEMIRALDQNQLFRFRK